MTLKPVRPSWAQIFSSMKTKQTANELTFQETPGCLWVVGLFFAVMGGILVWGTLGGFSNWNEVPFWQLALAFVIAASAIVGGVWVISKAPVTKVVINRIENAVLMTRWGFFGRRQTVFSFDEIKRFCLIEEKDDEGSPIWYLGMKMTDDEMIKITSLASHSEEYERKYVFETDEFMRKQIPPAQMVLEFEDENE